MNLASPTTSTSTNRGGRPKEWTEPRARRLVRLYIYTRLPLELILKLLEEGLWKPGYDAANKVKNSLLGNDPRWIRPKDEEDEKRRLASLKNSRRDTRLRSQQSAKDHDDAHLYGYRDDDSLTLAQSHLDSYEKFDIHPPMGHMPQETIDLTVDIGVGVPSSGHDYPSSQRFAPFIPGDADAARRGTGLTNSTETSVSSSFRTKLSTIPRDQVKGAWRVLKRYTLPKHHDLGGRGTPFFPTEPPAQSARRESYNFGGSSLDSSFAGYAVPGDFLTPDVFVRASRCDVQSISHRTKTCWCRIADQLRGVQNTWASSSRSVSYNISDNVYQSMDAFGNTAFHFLAASEGPHTRFVDLITQALAYPHFPVRAANTAGQTFLHVLHQSWFDDESSLDGLLHVLKDAGFDLLATDVYGRSFFHLLQNMKQGSARVPSHLLDWGLLRRRDAFGVRPMESRPVPAPSTFATQGAMQLDVPSMSEEESRIRSHYELLRIVTDAIKVDDSLASTAPRSEDARGRNALHCLAEVELELSRIQDSTHHDGGSSAGGGNQRQRKRKFKEEDEDVSVTRLEGGGDHQHPQEPYRSGSKRLDYLEGLLHAGIDPNHYDGSGQTPLMAFIRYRGEDSRADKEEMERAVQMLVEGGARLEQRNAAGETALHVAARSGKKVALCKLLQLRACPHVRDGRGASVLAAIDDLWEHTEGDGALTARLEACRAVFASLARGATFEPSVFQEWGVASPAVPLPGQTR
ncbi:ankyrin [Durotheca rogersii]|uniref:ankyrin n=1 Tax=Durotheca rogersii TaxID=419775 RepID=UPI0022210CD1|nr:ankyrin [Durotheca rogersii]KAI5864377.1 ankyrin [Durotheca rogersii]